MNLMEDAIPVYFRIILWFLHPPYIHPKPSSFGHANSGATPNPMLRRSPLPQPPLKLTSPSTDVNTTKEVVFLYRGLYIAASGMMVEQHRQEIVANNLANVNTAGFKKDEGVYGSFKEVLLMRTRDSKVEQVFGRYNLGVKTMAMVGTDFSPGGQYATNNPFDLSINGPGFFVVQTPNGIRYTRNGSFSLDPEGKLVTKEGYAVLGEGGPVILSMDGQFEVAPDGSIKNGRETIDKLLIVDFPDKSVLQKEGHNFWLTRDPGQEIKVDSRVSQGFLENSNVNIIKEMIAMIEVERAYNLDQRAVRSYDEILAKAADQIGRL